jgi:hypothetical protein
MSSVELSDQEWGQVMGLLSEAPWKVANPLLMKIGDQLRKQYVPPQPPGAPRLDANGQEIRNE